MITTIWSDGQQSLQHWWMMKRKSNRVVEQVPKQPCYWCGKPVTRGGYGINGLGQLLHIDKCFEANMRAHEKQLKDAR